MGVFPPQETRRYKELIKTPMNLSIVKRRLESRSPGDTRYVAPDQFITDVRLIFSNCAKYYKVPAANTVKQNGSAACEILYLYILLILNSIAISTINRT